jgi:peptidoglycan hydrolase FlgJ
MPPSVSGVRGVPATDPRDTRLRETARQLEGVFVQQMLKVMRETVPASGGLSDRSQGEEIFTALMDERIASETSVQWSRGLGDAIYRALRQKAHLDDPTTAVAPLVPSAAPRA